jgi:hypothetical protein
MGWLSDKPTRVRLAGHDPQRTSDSASIVLKDGFAGELPGTNVEHKRGDSEEIHRAGSFHWIECGRIGSQGGGYHRTRA